MKNQKIRLIGLLITLTTLLALVLPAAPAMAVAVGSVDLVILPASQSIQAGQSFTVTVQAVCGSQNTTGIDVFLDFDPTHLSVQSATAGTALTTILTDPIWDNSLGTFGFGAGKLTGIAPSGNFTVVTVTFTAIQPTTTPASLSFHTDHATSVRDTEAIIGDVTLTGNLIPGSYTIFGPAAKLAFTTQPGGAAAGNALSPQPVVAIQDAVGNTVPNDNSTDRKSVV